MRLLTWNCQGGFERKAHLLLSEKPDLAVIQECSRASLALLPKGYTGLWLAGKEAKGLALMFASTLEASAANVPHKSWLAPALVQGRLTFQLTSVWAVPHEECKTYVGQVTSCLERHAPWFMAIRCWPVT